ncbi:MAG: DNA gyrase subunit A [Coprothermobacterota bacterium]|nr:DNA gyrase subunit A [Coprothermobacterota bacterium]
MSKYLGERVLQVKVEEEMKRSYIDYAMSVIVGRALPDVRDGLKPVHRRVLYGMMDLSNFPDRPYKKSARIVGDVLGKYHPHGELAIYDTLVRLAQDFSSRYPLVDGHGNFGSVDGDEAAAMRYTEVRLSRLSMEMLADLDKDTVDFLPNFDGTLEEPSVLPTKIPNLLINGSSGIAVGMATNIPPQNLGEVVDGLVHRIDHPDCSIDELIERIPGPDFPTGGVIMGRDGIYQAYATGRGIVILRGVVQLESLKGGREQLLITELPFQVNKSTLVEKIAELVREKKISGISDIRDESDRSGMRVVLELKRDARPSTLINQLYKHTQLQISFGVIMLALVDNLPRVLDLASILDEFLRHRETVVERRSRFELNKAQARQHILLGLVIALDHIDEIVALIRSSRTVEEAKGGLIERFTLSELQAQAILEMRLARLTGLERSKIEVELAEVTRTIEYLMGLLSDREKRLAVIKEELLQIKAKYGNPRRTRIEMEAWNLGAEELIADEKVAISITADGYFKRSSMTTYRSQRRGGVGVFGVGLRKEDLVEDIFVCGTHQRVLFFTTAGKVYGVKAYEVPEGGRTDRGAPVRAFFALEEGEAISTALPIPNDCAEDYLVMVTNKGTTKSTLLVEFRNAGRRGIRALLLKEGDALCKVRRTSAENALVVFTQMGYAARFRASDLRPMGRSAGGVRGIRLREGDVVVGMEPVMPGRKLLLIAELGLGKKMRPESIPVHKRGGLGVIAFRVRAKTGLVVGGKMVAEGDDIIAITQNGKLIRMETKSIPTLGRNASGVRLIRAGEEDRVVAVARVVPEPVIEREEDNQQTLPL